MIINSHVHLNTDGNFFFYSDYGFEQFFTEMRNNQINISLPSLNPKINIFRCPNDPFIFTNDLANCTYNSHNRHHSFVFEKNGLLTIMCKTCGCILFQSNFDPLRMYNIELINITKPYRKIIRPLLYLSLCSNTIQSEINFFEKYYNNEFVGYKLHPWNDQVNLANFSIHTSKPILVHTGIRDLESGKNAITFAENNPKLKIILAHAGSLDEFCLKKISEMQNVFVDCCPSVFMFKNKFTSLYSPETVFSPEEIYYRALYYVSGDKIIFGSDSPWGNCKDELDVINKLQIPQNIKDQILYKNSISLYNLDLF